MSDDPIVYTATCTRCRVRDGKRVTLYQLTASGILVKRIKSEPEMRVRGSFESNCWRCGTEYRHLTTV